LDSHDYLLLTVAWASWVQSEKWFVFHGKDDMEGVPTSGITQIHTLGLDSQALVQRVPYWQAKETLIHAMGLKALY